MDLFQKIKTYFRKKKYPNTYSSEAYVRWLKNRGISIGEGVYFFAPSNTRIDTQRPHMLHIGDYVKITDGVSILCHDYSRSVTCNMPEYGNCGEAGITWIGNNVFIGIESIVLMGAHIGDNCIVGAGSVVSGNFKDNVVIGGNPAKVICSIDEFFEKRKAKEVEAAVLYANKWKEKFDRYPSVYEMTNAFSWLYLPHTKENIEEYSELFELNGVNRDNYLKQFLNSAPIFSSFDEFLEYCGKHEHSKVHE